MCAVSSASLLMAAPDAQQPTFRSGVDLIAVEAQVVDSNGHPIPALSPESFDVSINGRRRNVISAEFRRSADATGGSGASLSPEDSRTPPIGRTVIIAVDTSSFDAGAARAPLEAARAFVARLAPEDRVGLYAYPNGPQVAPGYERALVRRHLSTILGGRFQFTGVYHLRPAEVVDITASSALGTVSTLQSRLRRVRDATAAEIEANPVLGVQLRECPDDPVCGNRIVSEAQAMALHLESQAAMSLGGLDTLLRLLSEMPGRKTVVLISAGVVVSDRPGGRPDVGELSRVMGHVAAAANATVYTVHVDPSFTGIYSGARRQVVDSERSRDRALTGDWLDSFSESAGGMRIHVPVGAGEFAFDRVLRETSAVYLLGVEPADADRDGRPRALRVKVDHRGATVRSRQWVVIPARGS
jgi:VWFA-related protein